ncbi:MAG: 50S ribosomal protein L23 [Candidatus Pacebacteria bacterium]|nr:50S ribosomal protein L23 [Candidatus Paceibacterota bacterium]
MALNIFKKEEGEKAKKPVAKKEVVIKNKEALDLQKWNILKSPCITEKAVNMGAQGNFYTFHVSSDANKIEIKKAIEGKYKVSVLDVRTINIPRKKMVRGRIEGFRPGYKKAVVKLKEGDKIEIGAQ